MAEEIILTSIPKENFNFDGKKTDIKNSALEEFTKLHTFALTGVDKTNHITALATIVTRVEGGNLQLVATDLNGDKKEIHNSLIPRIEETKSIFKMVADNASHKNNGVQISLPENLNLDEVRDSAKPPYVENGVLFAQDMKQVENIIKVDQLLKKSPQTIFGETYEKHPKNHLPFIVNEKENKDIEVIILPQIIEHEKYFSLKASVFENGAFGKPIKISFPEGLEECDRIKIAQIIAIEPEERNALKVKADTYTKYDLKKKIKITKVIRVISILSFDMPNPLKNAKIS